jgi:type IV secretory pathway TraG/TraD family ATPase VirD4
MDNIPIDAAVTHFVVIGAPGSGKTVSIQLFLQSTAHRFMVPLPGATPERLVIFDPKRDILSFLAALGLEGDSVSILNPFDARGITWDLARDINSEALTQHFAALLIPEERQSSAPFFWQAAREVVEAVILGLAASYPGKWTLRDLLNALATTERIAAITSRSHKAKLKAERLLLDRTHFPAILSSIASKIGKFEVIAALWHNAANQRRFSVEEWLKGHGVLVLGNHPNFRESIAPINSLLLRVLSGHLLTGPEVDGPRTWIVLDEFRWMEQVECIRELLNQGRSKGVSVLLGIQDIEGLKVVYGDHAANEILGQCANKSFLRIGSYPTAEWAEKHFAAKEEIEIRTSIAKSKLLDAATTTRSYDKVTRPLFLQGEFLELPDPKTGILAGIHDVPRLGGVVATRELSRAVLEMVKRSLTSVPNEKPRPISDQQFPVWTPEEETLFLPTPPEPKPEAKAPPANNADESPFEKLKKMKRDDLFGPS